jgi:hypothetical protein
MFINFGALVYFLSELLRAVFLNSGYILNIIWEALKNTDFWAPQETN